MSARKKLAIILISLLIVIAGIFGLWYRNLMITIATFSKAPPPISIEATHVKQIPWEHQLTAVGTFNANKGLDLHPEITGIIRGIHFQSGQMVKQNDLLFTLNDSVEQAQKQQQTAALHLAELDYARKRQLGQKFLIDQASVDTAKATMDEARGMLAQIQAVINQKHIRAPFPGRVGIRLASLGEYVSPTTALVNLQMPSPMLFDFSIPEQFITTLKVGQVIEANIDGLGKTLQGRITAINSQVNTDSHNINVQATFDNTAGTITSGVFANTVIKTGDTELALVIPQTAITYSLYGDSVFSIQEKTDKDGKKSLIATRKTVQTGEKREGVVAISKGLTANEIVVTSGQLKLQDNAAVTITNKL